MPIPMRIPANVTEDWLPPKADASRGFRLRGNDKLWGYVRMPVSCINYRTGVLSV
jgi:hypothetical protein